MEGLAKKGLSSRQRDLYSIGHQPAMSVPLRSGEQTKSGMRVTVNPVGTTDATYSMEEVRACFPDGSLI